MNKTVNNNTIKAGDTVRAYDFETRCAEGPRACYVEGLVTRIFDSAQAGCRVYKISVTRDVWGDAETPNRVGTFVYTVVNGTPTTLGNITNFVDKLQTSCGCEDVSELPPEMRALIECSSCGEA